MEERLFQFAFTLLQANMPPSEVYQECMSLAHAIQQQSNDEVFIYKLNAAIMEQAAQALLAAQNKISEMELAKYREIAEQRRQANTHDYENWMEWEKKA